MAFVSNAARAFPSQPHQFEPKLGESPGIAHIMGHCGCLVAYRVPGGGVSMLPPGYPAMMGIIPCDCSEVLPIPTRFILTFKDKFRYVRHLKMECPEDLHQLLPQHILEHAPNMKSLEMKYEGAGYRCMGLKQYEECLAIVPGLERLDVIGWSEIDKRKLFIEALKNGKHDVARLIQESGDFASYLLADSDVCSRGGRPCEKRASTVLPHLSTGNIIEILSCYSVCTTVSRAYVAELLSRGYIGKHPDNPAGCALLAPVDFTAEYFVTEIPRLMVRCCAALSGGQLLSDNQPFMQYINAVFARLACEGLLERLRYVALAALLALADMKWGWCGVGELICGYVVCGTAYTRAIVDAAKILIPFEKNTAGIVHPVGGVDESLIVRCVRSSTVALRVIQCCVIPLYQDIRWSAQKSSGPAMIEDAIEMHTDRICDLVRRRIAEVNEYLPSLDDTCLEVPAKCAYAWNQRHHLIHPDRFPALQRLYVYLNSDAVVNAAVPSYAECIMRKTPLKMCLPYIREWVETGNGEDGFRDAEALVRDIHNLVLEFEESE